MNRLEFVAHSLNGPWQLTHRKLKTLDYAGRPRRPVLPARVPGDVHLDLLRAGRIPDPVQRDAPVHLRWMSDEEWWFTREFTAQPENARCHELVFDGLCYVADVWLNDLHLGRHLNMHRPFRVDVTRRLKARNTLVVRLLPFLPEVTDWPDINWSRGFNKAVPDHYCRQRGWMRKAAYSLGWDWTQGLALCGIWRDVRLESIPVARLQDIFVQARASGTVDLMLACRSALKTAAPAALILEIAEKQSGQCVAREQQQVLLAPGVTDYTVHTYIRNPKLWWPAGLGESFLYEARLTLAQEPQVLCEETVPFGLRDVRIDEPQIAADRGGFRIMVNDVPVYAKGADWVPPDIIPARVPVSHYAKLLDEALECGLNYLRFWGGGIYEREAFYRLCDEKGIMLWHDLMFGNGEIPDFSPAFVEEARQEVVWAIKHLRNHPSIIIWCGSNETDQICRGRGKERPNGRYYGQRLLFEDIPAWIAVLDSTRPYRPSSGCVGRHSPPDDSPLNPKHGVSHTVYDDPFGTDEPLDELTASFVNEWYAGSPPLEGSMRKFLNRNEFSYSHPTLKIHNFLDVLEARGVMPVLAAHFTHQDLSRLERLPPDELYELFRIWHAEMMTRCVEHYRRQKWLCSGNAFWMFDAAYTALDWSLVDYYGVPKPAFYAAKRANRAVLPVIGRYRDRLTVYIINDTRQAWPGTLELALRTFNGRTLYRVRQAVTVSANNSECFLTIPLKKFGVFDPGACFVQVDFTSRAGKLQVTNHRFLERYKALKLLAAEVRLRPVAGRKNAFKLSSTRFARWVSLTPCDERNRPDDNFFDLLPGEKKVVTFQKPLAAGAIRLRWQNVPGRSALQLSRFDPEIGDLVPGTPLPYTLELFNPTARKVTVPVRWDLPPGFSVTGPKTITLGAEQTRRETIALQADPFQVGLGVATPVMRVGDRVLNRRVRIQPAFRVSPPGELTLANQSGRTLDGRNLKFFCQSQAGQGMAHPIGVPKVPPGVWRVNLPIPDKVVPFSGELRLGSTLAAACWLGADDGAEIWEALPKAPFGDTGLVFARTRFDDLPDLMREGRGILIAREIAHPAVTYYGKSEARALIFLHHNPRRLFFNILVRDVDYDQPHVDDGLFYQGTCIELGLSVNEQKPDFEAVLALTPKGPQVYVRNCRGEAYRKIADDIRLKAFYQPRTRLLTYHLTLERDWITARPFAAVRLALVLGEPQAQGLTVFQGIHGSKNPLKYGVFRLA